MGLIWYCHQITRYNFKVSTTPCFKAPIQEKVSNNELSELTDYKKMVF